MATIVNYKVIAIIINLGLIRKHCGKISSLRCHVGSSPSGQNLTPWQKKAEPGGTQAAAAGGTVEAPTSGGMEAALAKAGMKAALAGLVVLSVEEFAG